jgi:hypothetical protein
MGIYRTHIKRHIQLPTDEFRILKPERLKLRRTQFELRQASNNVQRNRSLERQRL